MASLECGVCHQMFRHGNSLQRHAHFFITLDNVAMHDNLYGRYRYIGLYEIEFYIAYTAVFASKQIKVDGSKYLQTLEEEVETPLFPSHPRKK